MENRDFGETSKLFSRPLLSPDSCDSAEGRGCGFKAAAVAGEIFHSQDGHKAPAQAKQAKKAPNICAFTKQSTLRPGNDGENVDGFNKPAPILHFSLVGLFGPKLEPGIIDLQRRRAAQLLRLAAFPDSWSALRRFAP